MSVVYTLRMRKVLPLLVVGVLLSACGTHFAYATSPWGGLDAALNCDQVLGWAQDPDTPTTPIRVDFYVDATTSTSFAGSVMANQNQGRSDLAPIGAQNESYTFSVPAKYRDGVTHTIYAFGIDSDGSGATMLLTGSPKTFQCSTADKITGALDSITNIYVSGWALNENDNSQTTSVKFYFDAPYDQGGTLIGMTAANTQRPDLNAAGYTGNHGYRFAVPDQYLDGKSHSVYVYGVDSKSALIPLLTMPKTGTFPCSLVRCPSLPVSSNDGHLKIEATGSAQVVFNQATDACGPSPDDVPDTSQHAFRSADGIVHLIGNAPTGNFQSLGPSLDTVKRSCSRTYVSANDTALMDFKYHEWIMNPYTIDGTHVYAMAHNEWYPSLGNFCPVNIAAAPVVAANTLLISNDGGKTYAHPVNYKIGFSTVPWQSSFSCNAFYGDWNVSNIISKEGYYYAMFDRVADPLGVSNTATCLMRTQHLDDASSWQVWQGGDWSPLASSPKCASLPGLDSWNAYVVESVVYSTYLQKYIALAINNATPIQYSTSPDLIHWSTPQSILGLPVPQGTLLYGSLLDPTDTSRNFENIGQDPYLYVSLDGSIVRQQIHFTDLTSTGGGGDGGGGGGGGSNGGSGSTIIPFIPIASTTKPVATSTVPAPRALQKICPVITHMLTRGSRGSDVLALQTYFATQSLLSTDSATGYFGVLTERAVQQWQKSHNIVSAGNPNTTGFGAVGPKTRIAILGACK